ncbi:MAG: TIGR04150 pseudo-rSAM protein [Bacteroidales bacterium]|nr:TIGR04150 pseudo-rSAM protein [Bacteroidales bacterium]
MEQKYWLYIENHVYCNIKEDKVLLYNTVNGTFLEYTDCIVTELIKDIYKEDNLCVVGISNKHINDVDVQVFIKAIESNNMGGIIDAKESYRKPVQLAPVLNVQNDIEKLGADRTRSVGEDVIKYLTELNIFINSECSHNCIYCNRYSKQFNSCQKNNSSEELKPDIILRIKNQLQASSVARINILGGNIFKSDSLVFVNEAFKNWHNILHYCIHYKNFIGNENIIETLPALDVMVDFPLESDLETILNSDINGKITYNFIVKSIEEYNITANIIKTKSIVNYNIRPFFSGGNRPFFEDNVYIDKDDIFSQPMSMRSIFCNQTLNTNNFGILTVLSNGDVNANLNEKELGNIYESTLVELIYNELINSTAWLKTRDGKPCNTCNYQYLCSSPSNYESVLDKVNSCNVIN